jgi:predicted Ser/Thr protein kinase
MARKHYLLAHTYLAQVQCEWFNKADLELQALDKMLHAKDEGSIQSTQGIGKVVDDGMLCILKLHSVAHTILTNHL